ncbi:MAG: pilus assembly protein [Anaerolineaceae bacterium]|nr:pilus assembly protein [Anaerolineaceae bacterium]
MDKIIRNNKKQKGQGLVEFALILPIMLLLLFGIIESSRLIVHFVSVYSASREAARYGSAVGRLSESDPFFYEDCDGIRLAAMRVGFMAGLETGDIEIRYDTGPGTSPIDWTTYDQQTHFDSTTLTCDTTDGVVTLDGTPTDVGDEGRILIRVQKSFEPIVPIVPFPEVPLTSFAGRTFIKQIDLD